jgi:tRNA-Thr(GGU) m(6)t(6)A37 methyltransferase TsaA
MSKITTPPQDPFGVREGEITTELPATFDAGVYFIGRIRTPWTRREDCPKNAGESDTVCTLELDPRYAKALDKAETCSHLIVLYWMDRARRDLVVQTSRHYGEGRGTFALRSPARPNPIALSVVKLLKIDGTTLSIQNIDCLDNTPVLDIKPYFASVDAKPDATVGWHRDKK